MVDYASIIRSYIATGNYVLEQVEGRINTLWVEGRLTDNERAELMSIAAENARDVFQTNLLERMVKLEHDVYELMHPVDQYAIWVSGYQTQQHEIVRYDVTGDGELDLCQYNGGRSYTGLGIGKIEGWNLLDRELNIIATITRDADRAYIVTPVEPSEPELTEEDDELG